MATNGTTSTGPGAAPPYETRDGASLGDLVKDASVHLSTLVRSEIELAKVELAAETKKAVRGAVYFIVALAVVLLALPFIFVTLAEVLIAIGLPRWLGYLCITALFLLIAGLFGFLGYRKVRKLRAPQRTIETVKGHAALAHRGSTAAAAPNAGAPAVEASADQPPALPPSRA